MYTVTKSEPNEAALWKITFQQMENSLVDTGIFILPPIWFLYSLYSGEVFRSVDGIITGINKVHKICIHTLVFFYLNVYVFMV